jgi:hypothetical protein
MLTNPPAPPRLAVPRPPLLTLHAIAERAGLPVDTARSYYNRGTRAPLAARLAIAAAYRAYAAEVAALADALEHDAP